MQIAALYDIHGNLPALTAVLDEIEQIAPDQLVIGGDVVLGPMSAECLNVLKNLAIPKRFILGNCEVSILEQMNDSLHDDLPERALKDIQWTESQLDEGHKQFISTWNDTTTLDIVEIGRVLFCHATPTSTTQIFTKLTPESELLSLFESIDADVVVCGHTHMQFDRTIGDTRIVNANSVGMPYGKPGAQWAILGPSIELIHTNYNLRQAANSVRNTNYPWAFDFAENNIINPPSEEKMLKLFSNVMLE